MKAFEVEVDTPEEGAKLLDTLANYDIFQYENGVKPDYSNAGGLLMFDPDDDEDDASGSWLEWCDDDGCDIDEHMRIKGENQ
jgi:hypothetical protein